jgi:hypothetical protein
MAIKNSALYTQQAQVVGGFGARASAASVTAMVMFMHATYTCDGTELANDLINIGILPEGAIAIPDLFRVSTDGVGGTGATVATIGDPLDDDRYSATAVPISGVASVGVTQTNAVAVTPVAVPLGGEVIQAKLGLASGAFTVGKKISFRIAYRSTV